MPHAPDEVRTRRQQFRRHLGLARGRALRPAAYPLRSAIRPRQEARRRLVGIPFSAPSLAQIHFCRDAEASRGERSAGCVSRVHRKVTLSGTRCRERGAHLRRPASNAGSAAVRSVPHSSLRLARCVLFRRHDESQRDEATQQGAAPRGQLDARGGTGRGRRARERCRCRDVLDATGHGPNAEAQDTPLCLSVSPEDLRGSGARSAPLRSDPGTTVIVRPRIPRLSAAGTPWPISLSWMSSGRDVV